MFFKSSFLCIYEFVYFLSGECLFILAKDKTQVFIPTYFSLNITYSFYLNSEIADAAINKQRRFIFK